MSRGEAGRFFDFISIFFITFSYYVVSTEQWNNNDVHCGSLTGIRI